VSQVSVRAIITEFSLAAISPSVPVLVWLQLGNSPRMFADRQVLGLPVPGVDEESGGLNVVAAGPPGERAGPPGSPGSPWW
jgi:hypothetical protein